MFLQYKPNQRSALSSANEKIKQKPKQPNIFKPRLASVWSESKLKPYQLTRISIYLRDQLSQSSGRSMRQTEQNLFEWQPYDHP